MRAACSPAGGCHCCGGRLAGRRTAYCSRACDNLHKRRHFWRRARAAALRRDRRRCVRCGATGPVEVDHIVPLRGSPRSWTCLNHPENLRTLCVEHHRMVTRLARRRSGLGQLRWAE